MRLPPHDVGWAVRPSPVGVLTVVYGAEGLVAVRFGEEVHHGDGRQAARAPWADDVVRRVQEPLTPWRWPLAPQGTSFQQAVWAAVQAIPCGTTTTYGTLAEGMGRPRAVRAVGAAIGRNPWPIVVPCHRVVGRDGALTGYVGGLEAKRWLLAWERPTGPLFDGGLRA